MRRRLALLLACSGLLLGANAAFAAYSRVRELGEYSDSPMPKASCPAPPNTPPNSPNQCFVMARVTGMAMQINGHHSPFRVKKAGNIVAITLQLSKPSTTEIDYFKTTFGAPKTGPNGATPYGDAPQVQVAILKSLHKKQRFMLMRHSDTYDVEDYLGSTYTFALKAPLRIHKNEIVALTALTWLPVLGHPLDSKNAWRSSYRDNECGAPPNGKNRPSRPHEKVGTYKQYGCFFRQERPIYTATYVPDADKTNSSK